MPIFGVRYHSLGQTRYYSGPPSLREGEYVLVDAEQSLTLGRVVSGPLESLPHADENSLPAIVRQADAADLEKAEGNAALGRDAADFCRQCIQARRLDMKLVDVEVFFDRSKLIFYFTAPTRIDFRELVKDLVRQYHARIELRQIGVRHETQMVGAMGNCGMVCCCRRYLRKFASVTIRMAKEQNLFLNPAKISGSCGRLLCCLAFEQENYDNFHSRCPSLGKKYHTDNGNMKVLRANMFRNSLTVLDENNEETELGLDAWQALSPHRPEPQPGLRHSARAAPPSRQEDPDSDSLDDPAPPSAEGDFPVAEAFADAEKSPQSFQAEISGAGRGRRKRRHKNAPVDA